MNGCRADFRMAPVLRAIGLAACLLGASCVAVRAGAADEAASAAGLAAQERARALAAAGPLVP